MKKGLLIGGGVAVLAILVGVNLARQRERGTPVEMGKIGRQDLSAVVSASGTIDAKEAVNISATVLGKITRLAVEEGDTVRQGDFLLEIDPTEYASAVRSYEAAVRSAQADLRLAEAQLEKADLDLGRARELFAQGAQSQEQLTVAETAARVQKATVEAARSRLRQQEAGLEQARHNLSRCTITAPMTGLITRLNVKEGESAIMGTINNPGTVLAVISDLGTIEAQVQVDETEVVKVALGQPAKIEIDAFPDTSFAGHVTEIGNSPILSGVGTGQQAVDFEVKIRIDQPVPGVRPGLTCKAEVTTAERKDVVAAPIGAVTVRKWPPDPRAERGRRGKREAAVAAPDTAAGGKDKKKEKEGVFVVENGKVAFRPVRLGVTGEEHFEVLEGLTGGETVVTGPFRRLRELQHGDAVKAQKEKGRRGRDGASASDGDRD